MTDGAVGGKKKGGLRTRRKPGMRPLSAAKLDRPDPAIGIKFEGHRIDYEWFRDNQNPGRSGTIRGRLGGPAVVREGSGFVSRFLRRKMDRIWLATFRGE